MCPPLIDPTTVSFASLTDPANTRVIEQSFEFDLTSTEKLLSRYLDREITVEQPRGQGMETVTGTLVGTQGSLILKQADGSVRILPQNASVKLPEPARRAHQQAHPRMGHRIGEGRSAEGALHLPDRRHDLVDRLQPHLFRAAARRVQGRRRRMGHARESIGRIVQRREVEAHRRRRAARAATGRARREVGGACSRRLAASAGIPGESRSSSTTSTRWAGRPRSRQNSTKQIELFPAALQCGLREDPSCTTARRHGPTTTAAPVTDRDPGVQSNKKVDVYLSLKNTKENGLGVPLPAGKIRVSQLDPADKSLEFIGEDVIGHTPRDETVSVKLGSSFDVVGERRQVDYHIDTTAKWIEEEIEVKVRNRKETEAVSVDVREIALPLEQLVDHPQDRRLREGRCAHGPLPGEDRAGRRSGRALHRALHVVRTT